MPAKREDLTGKTFGRLTVIALSSITSNGDAKWLCSCSCGGESVSFGHNLKAGRATSCGCYAKENMSKVKKTHGHASDNRRTLTYRSWESMKERCYNVNSTNYKYYGERGIVVCDRWLESFDNFLTDMGERPSGCSIERIDTNGNYEPDNCKWAFDKEQAINRRNSLVWVVNGERYESSRDAATALGVRQSVIHRWCQGYISRHTGNLVPPKENCYTEKRYVETST